MNVESFLDTNIFVYLFDETNAHKRKNAEGLVSRALADGTSCISYQVVQETINVMIGKLNATPRNVQQMLECALIPLWQVYPTSTFYRRGVHLQARYRFSFYDSLIVAAALDAGCKTLYSEDLQHGQQIDGVTITDPFRL